jgi:outer membrane protein assembly factor BamB
MPRCLASLSVALLLTAAVGRLAGGPPVSIPWSPWRGPDGQGHSADTRVPLTWGEKENLLWKTRLPGRGNSTPIIWGDRVFLTASSKDGGERYVFCVDRRDGKLLWQQTASKGVPPGRTHSWNGYASASCATDGYRVYAFFGTPGLFCYDIEGKLLWHHKFGVFTCGNGWGTAASPFVIQDLGLVIQNCDNDGAAALPRGVPAADAAPMELVALDTVTGKVRWRTPRNQGRGFSTPRLVTAPSGRTDLVLNGPDGVWGYDPRTGKEVWHCVRHDPKESNKFGEPIPVSDGRHLYVLSGRPGPFQAIKLGGTGNLTRSDVLWEVRRKGRDVASPILWGDALYIADNKGLLTCFDLRTGSVRYSARLPPGGKALASPVAVGGKLLFVLDNGETVVVEPGPKLKVTARNVLGDNASLDFAASPAVADGRLYLRSQSYLYCIGGKQ